MILCPKGVLLHCEGKKITAWERWQASTIGGVRLVHKGTEHSYAVIPIDVWGYIVGVQIYPLYKGKFLPYAVQRYSTAGWNTHCARGWSFSHTGVKLYRGDMKLPPERGQVSTICSIYAEVKLFPKRWKFIPWGYEITSWEGGKFPP